jgi:hypothetical protein
VVLGAAGGAGTQAPSSAALGFPPAAMAGADFTADASTRGVTPSLGRVASDGADVVAVGSETGLLVPRAEFFFSHNGGGSWSLATESAAGGGPPPPGHAARLVAGSQGEWVAVGADSVWTSSNGQAWTLISTTGLPDTVTVLRRTSAGFIAAGKNAIYLSANGTSWTELPGPYGAIDIRYVAAAGSTVVISGDAPGGVSGAWLSRDGGHTWSPVAVPRGHGATAAIAGVAAVGHGFALARPAMAHGVVAADIYQSADGINWRFATTLSGFAAGMMNGGPGGAVVSGELSGSMAVFVSADGSQWKRAVLSGTSGVSANDVTGVAMTGNGAVVAAGGGDPQLTTIRAGGGGVSLNLSAIPGAVEPQLAVNAVAAEGSAQVAVGSANGYPAAWLSTNGGSDWTRAAGQTPAVLDRPGNEQLTGVTYGSAGWLAVGSVTGDSVSAGTAEHPVVLVSQDGGTWAAADDEPAFGASGVYTEQATAGPKGYVIVGYQQVPGGSDIAAAWWSDGLTGWQRANGGLNGLDGASGNREMLAVTAIMSRATSAGGFVAVGLQGNAPAVWISANGRGWSATLLSLPAGAVSAKLLHVTAVGGTLVAVGMSQSVSGASTPFAARSTDGGLMWTESALPVPRGAANVTALAAAGGTFTATGTFGTTPGHQDVVVWTSPNGVTWTAATPGGQGMAGPGIQAITGLTVSGSTLTGVGYTASPLAEEPLFWQSPIR